MDKFQIFTRKMYSYQSGARSPCTLICFRTLPVVVCVMFALLILYSLLSATSNAQIVSHELRRLAISTNQFGIDTLKALDRIEPPDKVLVFCPVCLSSSLMMIMMGSSKYSVVSAYRHALYVYSMKPQEINRGFKDIFEHIGMNQRQESPKTFKNHDEYDENMTFKTGPLNPQTTLDRVKRSDLMSLPKLIRIREFLEKSINEDSGEPWWVKMGKKPANSSRELKEIQQVSASRSNESITRASLRNVTSPIVAGQQNKRDTNLIDPDMSQMSATSNIYIQRGLLMNYNYNLLLRQNYKTVIHPVDFVRNVEETRQHINSLVSANTEGKIKDLVRRETFMSSLHPRIMIISTFHFRGTLDIQMKNKPTINGRIGGSGRARRTRYLEQSKKQLDPSQNITKSPYFIETEETLLKYGNFSNLDCGVIEIPFNNRLVSLVVVMPNNLNSTELLLTKLSGQVLSDMVNSLVVKKISIEIPVIKFDRGPINVEGLLKELGLANTFYGDKVYTSETGLNKWMRPVDVVHETSIDIGTINPNWPQTEDRLKVGAHDSRVIGKRQVNNISSHYHHIKLDKPFFYFVLDSINGLVLTMGRIRQ